MRAEPGVPKIFAFYLTVSALRLGFESAVLLVMNALVAAKTTPAAFATTAAPRAV